MNGRALHSECFEAALRSLLVTIGPRAEFNVRAINDGAEGVAAKWAYRRTRGQVAGPARGFTSVEFRCPKCGSRRWGSNSLARGLECSGDWGFCNGSLRIGKPCDFRWERSNDWRFFYEIPSGAAFPSPAEYAKRIGGQQQ